MTADTTCSWHLLSQAEYQICVVTKKAQYTPLKPVSADVSLPAQVGTCVTLVIPQKLVHTDSLDVLCVSLQVLRGVSIHIKPGESVAVVGASGSGKSTILKLATRLYDAVGGAVKVNGVNVKDLTTDSLRAAVAVVPQDTVLFNDTILQNIRWVQTYSKTAVAADGMWWLDLLHALSQ